MTVTEETIPAAAEPPEETPPASAAAHPDLADGRWKTMLDRWHQPEPWENGFGIGATAGEWPATDTAFTRKQASEVSELLWGRGGIEETFRRGRKELEPPQAGAPALSPEQEARLARARSLTEDLMSHQDPLEPLPPRQEEAFGALYAEESQQEPAAGQPDRRGPAAVVAGARALLGRVRRGPARKYPRGPVGRLLARHDAEERAIRAAYAPPEPQQLPTGAPRFTAAPLPRPYIAPPAFSPSALPVKVWELAMEPPPDEEDPATAQLRAVQETPEETGYAGE